MDARISFGEKLLLSLFGARRPGGAEGAPKREDEDPPERPASPDPPAPDPDDASR